MSKHNKLINNFTCTYLWCLPLFEKARQRIKEQEKQEAMSRIEIITPQKRKDETTT